jgi:receptor protein-tyrosine kinase/non-specific protein-tyrosine kinase
MYSISEGTMSKIYDAIMKAQREREANKKATTAYDFFSEPRAAEPQKKVHQIIPISDTQPGTTSNKVRRKPLITTERVPSITIEEFIAKPNSVMAEQFIKLRSAITTSNLVKSVRSVLITSCIPGEGKTNVSINLSATIAKGLDESVILVDADLRKKSLSSLLRLRDTVGISDVLEGNASIQEISVDTEIEGLTILPAGPDSPNPAELISSVRMRKFVEGLKNSYRDSYILIDSTPIVSTSEANILSQMVDGVIVVILADTTRRDVVRRELGTIDTDKILGVVLNCAEFEISGYYRKYYQGYNIKGKS